MTTQLQLINIIIIIIIIIIIRYYEPKYGGHLEIWQSYRASLTQC